MKIFISSGSNVKIFVQIVTNQLIALLGKVAQNEVLCAGVGESSWVRRHLFSFSKLLIFVVWFSHYALMRGWSGHISFLSLLKCLFSNFSSMFIGNPSLVLWLPFLSLPVWSSFKTLCLTLGKIYCFSFKITFDQQLALKISFLSAHIFAPINFCRDEIFCY